MAKARFWSEEPFQEGKQIALSHEESFHLSKVLRIQVGEEIQIGNGNGETAEAIVLQSNARNSVALISAVSKETAPSRVHLAFGLPKPQALESLVRKVAELGVASFQPLITQHGQSYTRWNNERWTRILIEVAKQCGYTFFPAFHAPITIEQWLLARDAKHTLVFCDENRRSSPAIQLDPKAELDLLIGPEGGWSPHEVELVGREEPKLLSLGKTILRVDTAGLVALTLVKEKNGELLG